MNVAWLVLGGNLGDPAKKLATAREKINEHCGKIVLKSSLYETAAWGNPDQPPYLNQAVCLHTLLNARQLIRRILKIEKSMGRIRSEKMGPRTIDIDIILFNEEIHHTGFLKVPHPHMHKRRFVLEPLSEIGPETRHPLFNKTILELLESCEDSLPVKKCT